MALRFYDLAGADPAVRFSPNCWRTRMALLHKGLDFEAVPWRFHETAALGFSGQARVPVLVDGGRVVADSWRIACHLEDAFPDRPSLFDGAGGRALARLISAWADAELHARLVRLIVLDIFAAIHPADRAYFRRSREARFGVALEAACPDPAAALAASRAALVPARAVLAERDFLAGDRPAYADYLLFGPFIWARTVSRLALLAPDDPVAAWRERMLDLFDAAPRHAPRAVAD